MSKGAIIEYPCAGTLIQGQLVARYKRFLADVKFDGKEFALDDTDIVQSDGSVVVHCPNTGSMLSLLPSSRDTPLPCTVSVIDREGPGASKRKYRCTLEMVQLGNTWIGVHSALANKIVATALTKGHISEFTNFSEMNREVKIGDSKLDFELIWKNANAIITRKVLLEVKSVTLAESLSHGSLRAVFPDCVSDRATRHASCLADYQKKYARGESEIPRIETAILFLIQRGDCLEFSCSKYDTAYCEALSIAEEAGVKILPYKCSLDPQTKEIRLSGCIPYVRQTKGKRETIKFNSNSGSPHDGNGKMKREKRKC